MDQKLSAEAVEFRLANGLKVILKADHTAPIASVWTWYRVGSRNELPGKTGVSHWVEHMQFKGTPSLAKGQIFRDVSRVGGTLNALTSHDWTTYFETVPIGEIELPLRIESDRMTNSIFDAGEVESERTVILSERQGAENNPAFMLYEAVNGAAFGRHPYGHMVIGHEADLRRITRDELYGHYRRFYHPGNAFIVAVGDFEIETLLRPIEAMFGPTAPGDLADASAVASEPAQRAERRVELRRPSGAAYLRMAFKAPAAEDADLVPLLVAETILSGGKPMGFGGGGGMGRSSRLYRALVAPGLTRSAESDMSVTIDPYLFQIAATALPHTPLSRIEHVIDDELEKLRNDLAPKVELNRALRQLESQFVYSAEGVTNQAFWLGQWEIVGDWRRATMLQDEIRSVSATDVQRVVQRYLVPEQRTVGWLEPEPATGGGVDALRDDKASRVFTNAAVWGLDGPRANGQSERRAFQRAALPNGIVVLGQDRPASRSIALRLRLLAGSVHEPAIEGGLAYLTAKSLLRGSSGLTFEEFNRRNDELGSSFTVETGREFVEVRVRALRDDLEEVIGLLAQTVTQPDFPSAEIDLVKAEQLGAIAELDNDTRSTADRLMRRAVYPEPNPLGRRMLGTAEAVGELDRGAVRMFHEDQYGPVGAAIAVVGGLGEFDRAVELLDTAFGSWQRSSRPRLDAGMAQTNDAAIRVAAEVPGKSQVDLALGLATIPRNHADYYALDLANLILGRLGLMGRLGAEVRDRQGLAYYVFSQIEPRRDGSLWTAHAGIDPDNTERAITEMTAELARLRTDRIGSEELRDAKSYSVGALPLALETSDGVAATLLTIELFGLGLDYLERYPGLIGRVTEDEALQAVGQHLDPERLVVAVAGRS